MIDIAGAVFFSLFGLFFVILHSRLGHFAVSLWAKRFPRIKIWEKGYRVFFLVVGVGFLIFGLLLGFQIIGPE
jgi:hypothetical protein